MAKLFILEGETFNGNHTYRHRKHYRKRYSNRVPGILSGTLDFDFMGKRSLLKKFKNVGKGVVKIVAMPVTATYTVAKSVTKAATHAVLNPSLQNFSRIVTDPSVRLKNEVKMNVRNIGHTTAEAGRAVSTGTSRTVKGTVYSMNVIRRVAKRLIKTVARQVLFSGDTLLGASISSIPKNAAKAAIMAPATAAVLASTITAPAAPAVPVLVNEVVDELYEAMLRNVKRGLTPKKAAELALNDLDKKEPGEENDPSALGTPMLLLGVAALVGLFVFLKKRK